MFKVGSYLLSVWCTAAVLVLCDLCEQSQREWCAPIHSLSSTFTSHLKLPACLRCAGYITAKLGLFSSPYCTPESCTAIVRAVNSRFVNEKPQLQKQMLSLLELSLMAQKLKKKQPNIQPSSRKPFNISAEIHSMKSYSRVARALN